MSGSGAEGDGGGGPAGGGGATHVFVYGTLMEGGGAGAFLRGCARLGPGTVRGTLYDMDGEYPALMLAGTDRVHGEVWRCPARVLAELDRYEGVAEGLFRRVAVQVGRHACWSYVAGPRLGRRLTLARRVPGGRWPVDPP
jgi:gamma-glutamylcyclotransferase (GGCT)/AIG2-like uncharacterized protein YtfP